MNIDELAKMQEGLLGGLQEALKLRGLDKVVTSEPAELLKGRLAHIGERIDGLEQSKQLFIAGVDDQIGRLKEEALALQAGIKRTMSSRTATATDAPKASPRKATAKRGASATKRKSGKK